MQTLVDLAGPLQVRLEDLIELDDGRVLACVHLIGPNAATLAPYTDSFAVVHQLRAGLVVEADYYLDRAAALPAVGLAE